MSITSIVANAGPGTGKTYTGTKSCLWLKTDDKNLFLDRIQHTEEQLDIWKKMEEFELPPKPKILYAAYNKDFMPEVKEKVHTTGTHIPKISTIHGAGYSVLRNKYGYVRINPQRGFYLVEKLTGVSFYKLKDSFKWLSTLRHLEKIKEQLLPIAESSFIQVNQQFDSLANMPIHKEMVDQANKLIVAMKEVDRKVGIEYIDQVWLPLFILKSPQYDLGIIDECQDLSPSRLLLVQKLCRHLLYLGDPDQAINAFAGADPRSFEKVQKACQEEYPLKISFRNPPNIVNKANALMKNRIIPDTSKRVWLRTNNTTPGPETACTLNELPTHIQDRPEYNIILCRYNAPLIQCALRLIKAEVPCFIYGKSIVKELMNIVKGRKASSLDELAYKLDQYEERTKNSNSEYIYFVVKDKIDCIRSIMTMCEDIDDIERATKELIKENKKHSVALSTIHKAKGKERKHVHILYPPIESHFAKTQEQKQQEQNLHYVALTRTSHSYNLIHRA